jgi:pyruvate ferredoxin oxidoreductase delta subunit/pyruvate ferredoxin oxidoreductase gamma subunit
MSAIKPFLRDTTPVSFDDIPEATAYEAGFLVSKNAGWRNFRPVVDAEKCVGCLQCYMYCPDGVIFKDGKKVSIDYDFCKGCGICKNICRLGAVSMVEEK